MTTFTLTSDERKVAESGSVDFSKFTDPTKGWDNVDYLSETRKLDGISFTAQDVLDNGFTVEQASSLLKSLEDKGVILGDIYLDVIELDTITETDEYFKEKFKSKTTLNDNWMWTVNEDFINWIASTN